MKRAAERLPPPLRSESDANALKRVFVVGFPRSGTTWMMWLLAKLPSVVALHQSGMFHALRDVERWWRASHSFSKQAGENGEEGAAAPAAPDFADTTGVLPVDDYFGLVRPMCAHVHACVARASDASEAVVEQTPENMEFQETIRHVFPGAWFLHVIRDPRDACVSMLRAAKAWDNELPGRVIHVANRWNEYMRRADDLRKSTDRYVEVRYEDLKADCPAELERIARELGLSADRQACEAAVRACELEKMRGGAKLPEGFFGAGISGGWRGRLSGSDQRLIEYIAREHMERLGYRPEHPRAHQKPMRLRFHEALARWLAKARGPWLRRTRRVRMAVTHFCEEIRYTQRMRRP